MKITATVYDAEVSERDLVVVVNNGGATFNVNGDECYTINLQELLSLIAAVLAVLRRDE